MADAKPKSVNMFNKLTQAEKRELHRKLWSGMATFHNVTKDYTDPNYRHLYYELWDLATLQELN